MLHLARHSLCRIRSVFILICLLGGLVLVGCASSINSPLGDHSAAISSGTLAYHYRPAQTPVVVFQAGLGDGESVWNSVTERLPASQSYLTYSRLGYGGSSSAKGVRDACQIARDQHELLEKLGVPKPYWLVGHSIGGLYQYVYAQLYPQEVAGMLLLDPTHPKHWQYLQSDAPVAAGIIRTLRATTFFGATRLEFDGQAECLGQLPMKLEPHISAHTRILTSTEARAGEQGAFQDVLAKLRLDWLRLAGIKATEPVAHATHYIQRDQPQVVADAIAQFH